jgi:hypothetical protein
MSYRLLEDTLQESNKHLLSIWECPLDDERFLLHNHLDFIHERLETRLYTRGFRIRISNSIPSILAISLFHM